LLVRFERGQLSEFDSRKLLTVLAVLNLEMNFTDVGMFGTLNELRRERGGA
jgi:HTH-type transcriptional regulator / antitoxin HipB